MTPEALAPFAIPAARRAEGDPVPLPYLWDDADQAAGSHSIELEVFVLTQAMERESLPPYRLALSNTRHLYWTPAQLVAHHASGGCDLRPGDMFGSGTISAPERSGSGCLLELTHGGREPVALPSGETRRFLEDGDTVIFRGGASREGFISIGFGECRATILSAIGEAGPINKLF